MCASMMVRFTVPRFIGSKLTVLAKKKLRIKRYLD